MRIFYIETGRRKKCLVHSYGCQQNVSDGEKLKGTYGPDGL